MLKLFSWLIFRVTKQNITTLEQLTKRIQSPRDLERKKWGKLTLLCHPRLKTGPIGDGYVSTIDFFLPIDMISQDGRRFNFFFDSWGLTLASQAININSERLFCVRVFEVLQKSLYKLLKIDWNRKMEKFYF